MSPQTRVGSFTCALAALALATGCASSPKPRPSPERRTVERHQIDGDKYSAGATVGDDGTLTVEVTRTAQCEIQVRHEDSWQIERSEPCVRAVEAEVVELHVVLDFTPGYRQPKLRAKLDSAGKATFQLSDIRKTLLWLKGNDGPALPVRVRVPRKGYGGDLMDARLEVLSPLLEEWAVSARKEIAQRVADTDAQRTAAWAPTTREEVQANRCNTKRYEELEKVGDFIAQNALHEPVVLSTQKISVAGPKARPDAFKPAHTNLFHFVAVGYGPVQLELAANGRRVGPSPSVHMKAAVATVSNYGLKFDTLVAKVGSQDGATLRVNGEGCVLVMVFAQQE